MKIGDLRHRLHLCSQKDVIVGTDMKLNRIDVLQMWASIEGKAGSTWSPQGATIEENKEKRSHIITTRYHRDIDVTMLAWLYEERFKSSPRWFKILGVNQTEKAGNEFFIFNCRVMERGDSIPKPNSVEQCSTVQEMPSGVKL